jgi:hypothetical protein
VQLAGSGADVALDQAIDARAHERLRSGLGGCNERLERREDRHVDVELVDVDELEPPAAWVA